jgi:dienelactone hydrolase
MNKQDGMSRLGGASQKQTEVAVLAAGCFRGVEDDSDRLSAKIVKSATLKVYPGAPHGMCSTHKDQANADLLAFIRGEQAATA